MAENFYKALKWYAIMVFIMGGVALLVYADMHESIKPVMPAILCFGGATVLTLIWKELSGRLVFSSLVLVISFAFIAQKKYFPLWFYVVTGVRVPVDYVWLWFGLVFALGVPIMTFIFDRYGDRF